jgi:hypothetical protein
MSRSDKFEDQYEGTFSEPTLKKSENYRLTTWFLKFYKIHREKVAISSWHINEYESFAMWQIFTQNSEGHTIYNWSIAKRTSSENNYKQYIGEVNYIDYKKEYIPLTICFFPFYSNEKLSVRAWSPISDVSDNMISLNDGLKINVNIDQLIEKIYIHPKSENWYKDLVINL